MIDFDELNSAIAELNRTFQLEAYEAFEVAWVAVLKIANLLPGKSEHDRLKELLDRMPLDYARSIMARPEVDTLHQPVSSLGDIVIVTT